MKYDVIGDIHGHAGKLTALLRKMGYRHHMGAWRHPEKMVIFVEDFIDRGPGRSEPSASSAKCSMPVRRNAACACSAFVTGRQGM
jgi:hypothetical protein